MDDTCAILGIAIVVDEDACRTCCLPQRDLLVERAISALDQRNVARHKAVKVTRTATSGCDNSNKRVGGATTLVPHGAELSAVLVAAWQGRFLSTHSSITREPGLWQACHMSSTHQLQLWGHQLLHSAANTQAKPTMHTCQ